jgi:hypothetical protein
MFNFEVLCSCLILETLVGSGDSAIRNEVFTPSPPPLQLTPVKIFNDVVCSFVEFLDFTPTHYRI